MEDKKKINILIAFVIILFFGYLTIWFKIEMLDRADDSIIEINKIQTENMGIVTHILDLHNGMFADIYNITVSKPKVNLIK